MGVTMTVKNNKKGQMSLIDITDVQDDSFDAEWKKEWQDMPEFNCEDLHPFKSIIVHFETREDMEKFSKLIEQNITALTISLWYPKVKIDKVTNIRWVEKNE
jgi:hypothetical protein